MCPSCRCAPGAMPCRLASPLTATLPSSSSTTPVCPCMPVQSLLAAWRAELARQPLSMSEAEAAELLGLPASGGAAVAEEDVRRAYRCAWALGRMPVRLLPVGHLRGKQPQQGQQPAFCCRAMARQYHPDKNPAGRAQFQRVHAAYLRLQAGISASQGPQVRRGAGPQGWQGLPACAWLQVASVSGTGGARCSLPRVLPVLRAGLAHCAHPASPKHPVPTLYPRASHL